MNWQPRGVLGPVVTPFAPDESPDLDAFERNLRGHLEAGLDGVVVCGSTGEAALLDDAERNTLTELARGVVPADRTLIVGTGAESTLACVRRTRDAGARGADAVLVVSPHYYAAAMTSDALFAHFARVADASPVPVLLYNIRKYAHFRLEPELVARLARHGNIVGMKDSDGDMDVLSRFLDAQGDGFSVLTGHGGTWATALGLGVRGGILAVALFAPALCIDAWRAHHEGRPDDAEQASRRMVPLAAEIVARMGVAGVKRALDEVGLRGGQVRSPLQPLGAADGLRVGELLREAGAPALA